MSYTCQFHVCIVSLITFSYRSHNCNVDIVIYLSFNCLFSFQGTTFHYIRHVIISYCQYPILFNRNIYSALLDILDSSKHKDLLNLTVNLIFYR